MASVRIVMLSFFAMNVISLYTKVSEVWTIDFDIPMYILFFADNKSNLVI